MVPAALVQLDRWPITTNGKLDEEALAEAARDRAMETLPATASLAELEQAVCAIWAHVLAVADVEPTANVFDLGAHSLIVTRVHRRLQASIGGTFPVHEIFENPSPRDLARRIAASRRKD